MGEHVVTMAQLIMEEHVFTIFNDQRYICLIGFPARFANSKEKVARAGSGLEFGTKEQLANACWFCLCLQLLFKALLTLDVKMCCHSYAKNPVSLVEPVKQRGLAF